MINNTIVKAFATLTLAFVLSLCVASTRMINDHNNVVIIKQSSVQGVPKDSSILATIDGHWLSVVFLEDLGQVVVKITTAEGVEVDTSALYTPNGVNFYIANTGSYVVLFFLPDGDEYYGEFEVTD